MGSFPANEFGLYDMGGNVWQWCEEWWDTEHKKRVTRGASWNNSDRDSLLSSFRAYGPAENRGNSGGFRCVLAPVASPSATSKSSASVRPASFPPGQWVRPYNKFEDLPEEYREAGSGGDV